MYHKHLFDLLPSKECSVCLEPMTPETATMLMCGHIFHQSCEKFTNCPICRRPVIVWENTLTIRAASTELTELNNNINNLVDAYVYCRKQNYLLRKNCSFKAELAVLAYKKGKGQFSQEELLTDPDVKALVEKHGQIGMLKLDTVSGELVYVEELQPVSFSNQANSTMRDLESLLNIFESL